MIIEINTQNSSPIYEQLRDQVIFGIAAKKLAPNEELPSVRRLAADLGIHFHTVNKAYTILCDEGYIIIDRRKGAVVAQAAQNGDAFLSMLSRKLLLNAAEAVCREMSEEEFIDLCSKCYKNAVNNLEL